MRRLTLAVGLSLLLSLPAFAQPEVILRSERRTDTIESIDLQSRQLLLRRPSGRLVTVTVPPRHARDLARLNPGEQVQINQIDLIAAQKVAPGTPEPESTMIGGDFGPVATGGFAVSRERNRVRIESTDPANNRVTFVSQDNISRTVTVRQPALQALLRDLQPGDLVDVTITEVLSLLAR
jgi:hypothetical protein